MARAGHIVAETLALMRRTVRPGHAAPKTSTRLAEEFIRSHPGARPSFKGLYGFPKTLCTSINEEIVHGIPSPKRVLREGNIVSIDVGVQSGGAARRFGDHGCRWARFRPRPTRLLGSPRSAWPRGSPQARLGNQVGDIGHAVQTIAEAAGFGVVRELVGHGIGTQFHEEPQVPNHGQPNAGRGCWRG